MNALTIAGISAISYFGLAVLDVFVRDYFFRHRAYLKSLQQEPHMNFDKFRKAHKDDDLYINVRGISVPDPLTYPLVRIANSRPMKKIFPLGNSTD